MMKLNFDLTLWKTLEGPCWIVICGGASDVEYLAGDDWNLGLACHLMG